VSITISTNTASLSAQRSLRTHSDSEKSAIEKMSSGSRINQAADDAAGLSISEHLKSSIRSGRQAIRNIQDGISLVQVSEGAMTEVSNILVRLRELSIQGASDTIGNTERGFINREVAQLVSEVDRIAGSTEYNGKNLLATGPQYLAVQAGIHNDPNLDRLYYDLWIGNSTASKLGITGVSVATKDNSRENLDVLDHAISRVSKNRATLGALQNRMVSAIQNGTIPDENPAASNSRNRKADYAAEASNLTKAKILAQGSIAVLSQANQSGNIALKLLG